MTGWAACCLILFVFAPIALAMGLAVRSRYPEIKDQHLWWLD